MATAFEIKGPIALYRKPYTTTSTVSFPIPTPTAVAGLVAAILGLKNNSDFTSASAGYWSQFTGTRVAIQRLNRTAWLSAAINFWNTKNPQKNIHNQILHQFVRDPHYRIFVDGNLADRLADQLAAGIYHFTPNLGVAYALAEPIYLEKFDPQPFEQVDLLEVHSALPLSVDIEAGIDYLATKGLMKDTFPFRLDDSRRVIETITLLYPASPGQGIKLTPRPELDYFNFHGDGIAWLPRW